MSTVAHGYGEDALIEQPTIALFQQLGWTTANCYAETYGPSGTLGRETSADVVLVAQLRPALERLNPDAPSEAIDAAVDELRRDRRAMSAAAANRDVYRLLKDGVKVPLPAGDGAAETVETVRVVDWDTPANNTFFLASQLWISGDVYKRRADLVGFVNGLPLVFVELKASHKALKNAYDHNLTDYRATIPQVFWFNALVLLSNGSQARVGSSTADWEHFAEWKRIDDEGEAGVVSLETMVRGTCEPARLLDLVENFTLFDEGRGGLVKVVARTHQYLGVNAAVAALQSIDRNHGRLGVFWHTQGSGKSVSMVFFAQKVLRKLPGNWTFLVVTDRQELDEQIYKQFVSTGAVTEKQAQAASGADLQRLLREDHRYVFTLIQKFRTERGEPYPKLSDRSDVVVITDEAHRSQYDVFALNMRRALPNAAFIGFTGTPLMAGEERTREVFGDYVSIYGFQQSIEDHATVPLYYENRIPELQLVNANLNDDMQELLEAADLDPAQELKLEREFAREYHLVTRDDRLEKIAEDLAAHFLGRGHRGKAMVVSIDKATAVRMHDKVKRQLARGLDALRARLATAPEEERADLVDAIAFGERVDLAVVVSQGQNEVAEMKAKGLDIVPHRKRMVTEDLETEFKDPNDPLALVFVCAMWMTGFDVPSCSTIYLDKPMRNHTLMQTIARANRVWKDKTNGLIVDYVGVFRDLKRALAIYGQPGGGADTPVHDKAELVERLRQAIAEAVAFCQPRGVDLAAIRAAQGFARVKLLDDAVEAVVENDESKRAFFVLAANAAVLFRAVLPDPSASEFAPTVVLLIVLAEKVRSLTPPADIAAVMAQVEALLDVSTAAEPYVIQEGRAEYDTSRLIDLGKIDFEALRAAFDKGRKRTEAEKLRGRLAAKLAQMIGLNRSRMDYLARFQQMIEEYNAGALNVQQFFDELLAFAGKLSAEEQRHVAEGLTEEELALFDLLTKPDPQLSDAEEQAVKKAARELLATLKREKLVLDWRQRMQTRAAVRVHIDKLLDDLLPPAYTPELYQRKCELAYQHVYDSYFGDGQSIYPAA